MTSFIKLRIYFKKKNAFSSLPYRCWGSSATVSLLSAVGTATLLPALTTQTLLKHFHRQSAFSGQVGRRSHNYFSALVQGLGGHRVARVWFGFLASSVWGSQPDNAKKAVVWPALQSQQSAFELALLREGAVTMNVHGCFLYLFMSLANTACLSYLFLAAYHFVWQYYMKQFIVMTPIHIVGTILKYHSLGFSFGGGSQLRYCCTMRVALGFSFPWILLWPLNFICYFIASL